MRINFIGQGSRRICIFRGLRRDASSNDDTVFSFNRSNSFFFSLFFFFFFPTANYCLRLTMLHHFPQLPFLPLPFLSFFRSFFSFFPSSSIALDRED